jgi:hypothetical protein
MGGFVRGAPAGRGSAEPDSASTSREWQAEQPLDEKERSEIEAKVLAEIEAAIVAVLNEHKDLLQVLRDGPSEGPRDCAQRVARTDLNTTLGNLVAEMRALGRDTRQRCSKGLVKLLPALLGLALDWSSLQRLREDHRAKRRHYFVAGFREEFMAQLLSEQLQESEPSRIREGDSVDVPEAPDVVQVGGLETGPSVDGRMEEIEAAVWKKVFKEDGEYVRKDSRFRLQGNLGAMKNQKRQIVLLLPAVDEPRAVDLVSQLPELLWVERGPKGLAAFRVENEYQLGANLNELLKLMRD